MLYKIKEWLIGRNSESNYLATTLAFFYDIFYFIRVQKLFSALLGPMFHRSQNLIELDITYACNLKCFSCNRSCGLAPSNDNLNLEQIRRFINESISRKIDWQRIRLLGGEPTMHPQLLELVQELKTYKDRYCPSAIIEVVTNGICLDKIEVLSQLGDDVKVVNTAKKSKANTFINFNIAPKDLAQFRFSDYSCGCWVPELCGINLSPYGYYCCGAGAGIDRVFGFNVGRKSLPEESDSLQDQMAILCGYCFHFKSIKRINIYSESISPSWHEAFEKYKTLRPKISSF